MLFFFIAEKQQVAVVPAVQHDDKFNGLVALLLDNQILCMASVRCTAKGHLLCQEGGANLWGSGALSPSAFPWGSVQELTEFTAQGMVAHS